MRIKKILAVALSVSMLFGMSTMVMAKPSITTALDTNNVSSSQGTVSVSKDVDTANLPEEGKKGVEALKSIKAGTTLREAMKAAGLDVETFTVQSGSGKEIKLEDLKALTTVADFKIEGAEPSEENPVDVTFTVNNATDDIEIYALYFCEEHGWELLETKTADAKNQVVASFHSAGGPVALVYVDKADSSSDEKAPGTK